MNEANELIGSFIKSNTLLNLSLLLDGEWGEGKSFYIKEVAIPYIENILKKKVLYVSLNGTSSIDQFYEDLLFARLPLLKSVSESNAAKLAGGMVKTALNIAGRNSENFKVNISDFGFDAIKPRHLSMKDYVMIIDDLERIREKNIETLVSILGIISREFIEDESVKVIFVADESKLENINGYREIKEKYIGYTYKFKPNKKDQIKSLVGKIDNESFKNMVLEKVHVIGAISHEIGLRNLRTIAYALDLYEQLFLLIKNRSQGIQNSLLFTCLILALEYKSGEVKLFDKNHIPILYRERDSVTRILGKDDEESQHIKYKYFYYRTLEILRQKHFQIVFLDDPQVRFLISGDLRGHEAEDLLTNLEIEVAEVINSKIIQASETLHNFYTYTNEQVGEAWDTLNSLINHSKYNLYELCRCCELVFSTDAINYLPYTYEEAELLFRRALIRVTVSDEISRKLINRISFFKKENKIPNSIETKLYEYAQKIELEQKVNVELEYTSVLTDNIERDVIDVLHAWLNIDIATLTNIIMKNLDKTMILKNYYRAIIYIVQEDGSHFMKRNEELKMKAQRLITNLIEQKASEKAVGLNKFWIDHIVQTIITKND